MTALTSEDGQFSIRPEMAVDIAYMINTAEGYLMNNQMDRMGIAELIVEYLDGNMSPEEVRKELKESYDNDH